MRAVRPVVIAATVIAVFTVAFLVWKGRSGSDESIVPRPDESAEHDDHDEGEQKRVVRLTASQMEEFGIDVQAASGGAIEKHITLPGEIAANMDRATHIVPRFPGIVTEVRKTVGDRVEKGEVLAIMEGNESLTRYEMKSLVEGTVVEKHIAVGEVLGESDQAFFIADLSTVWVDLRVYQEQLSVVRRGQQAVVSEGHDTPDVVGTISYVAPVVDEHTRTGLARIVLANEDGRWRLGQFVTGKILVSRDAASILVPATALQTFEGRTSIFVETDEGFEPRPVVVGRSDQANVEVVSGLGAGERYIAQGGFTLKAELLKSTLGEGHAH